MIQEKKTATNIGVGFGLLLQLSGSYVQRQVDGMFLIGTAMMFAGLLLFLWGCVNYAQGKGYSGLWGVLGLLSCLGLIMLALLPDRNK